MEKKAKKQIKELFVQDLTKVQGGAAVSLMPRCPQITTLACGEEPFGCSGC